MGEYSSLSVLVNPNYPQILYTNEFTETISLTISPDTTDEQPAKAFQR